MPTAYVTGGASGIGKAVAKMLVQNGIQVFIADRDVGGTADAVSELSEDGEVAHGTQMDAADWESQVTAFSEAVAIFGRIDYVYPIAGIGEKKWIPNNPEILGFIRPDLSVLDVDVTGVLYTIGLAIQQFRKQEPNEHGFRGKIGCVASVCGFYNVPTLPIYTASKHAITGFVRSYGKYLPEEHITLNSANPNVVRTNISTPAFYDSLEEKGLLTPIEGVIEVFEKLLGANPASGECWEIGPNYKTQGIVATKGQAYLDSESEQVCELLRLRGRPLHFPH